MQMKKLTALFVVSAFALGAGFASAASSKPAAKPADAKSDAKPNNVFEDWRLQCQKPEGATEDVCELTQFAIMMNKEGEPAAATPPQGDQKGDQKPEQKGQLLLTVGIIKPAGVDAPRMIMRAPLGVFLQPSPVINVPGHKEVQVPFLRCDNSGCFSVPLSMAKEFLDAAKATDAAVAKDAKAPNGTVTISFAVNQQGKGNQATNVTLPLSMKGLTKGLAALEAKSMPAPATPAKDAPKKK